MGGPISRHSVEPFGGHHSGVDPNSGPYSGRYKPPFGMNHLSCEGSQYIRVSPSQKSRPSTFNPSVQNDEGSEFYDEDESNGDADAPANVDSFGLAGRITAPMALRNKLLSQE